jgi:DNA-binding MarR family transcriptional regulator
MTEPVENRTGLMGRRRPGRPGESPASPLSDEALETSKLLLELIHASYATRAADATGRPSSADAPADVRRGAPPHAIRAAIHVYQHGERTVGELAEGLGISYGWASRVVSELEASGVVTRSADPADRRVVRVAIAPAAKSMVESAYRWRGDAVARALEALDEPGRRAVRTFLRNAIDELTRAGRGRRPPVG